MGLKHVWTYVLYYPLSIYHPVVYSRSWGRGPASLSSSLYAVRCILILILILSSCVSRPAFRALCRVELSSSHNDASRNLTSAVHQPCINIVQYPRPRPRPRPQSVSISQPHVNSPSLTPHRQTRSRAEHRPPGPRCIGTTRAYRRGGRDHESAREPRRAMVSSLFSCSSTLSDCVT